MSRLLIAVLTLVLAAPAALAQTLPADFSAPRVDASPLDIASYNPDEQGDAEITVTYSRPYKKDREIFGALVPYGEVWRTGANEATTIRLTRDMVLGGAEVPAGTYSLFTIPYEDHWTVILNRVVNQWGAYSYDESQDVVRFDVPATRLDKTVENFSIMFTDTDDGPAMVMAWDQTVSIIPIRS